MVGIDGNNPIFDFHYIKIDSCLLKMQLIHSKIWKYLWYHQKIVQNRLVHLPKKWIICVFNHWGTSPCIVTPYPDYRVVSPVWFDMFGSAHLDVRAIVSLCVCVYIMVYVDGGCVCAHFGCMCLCVCVCVFMYGKESWKWWNRYFMVIVAIVCCTIDIRCVFGFYYNFIPSVCTESQKVHAAVAVALYTVKYIVSRLVDTLPLSCASHLSVSAWSMCECERAHARAQKESHMKTGARARVHRERETHTVNELCCLCAIPFPSALLEANRKTNFIPDMNCALSSCVLASVCSPVQWFGSSVRLVRFFIRYFSGSFFLFSLLFYYVQ